MIEHYYFDENVFGSENWFGYSNLYKSIVENCQNESKIVEVGSWMGRSTSYMSVEIANSKILNFIVLILGKEVLITKEEKNFLSYIIFF